MSHVVCVDDPVAGMLSWELSSKLNEHLDRLPVAMRSEIMDIIQRELHGLVCMLSGIMYMPESIQSLARIHAAREAEFSKLVIAHIETVKRHQDNQRN